MPSDTLMYIWEDPDRATERTSASRGWHICQKEAVREWGSSSVMSMTATSPVVVCSGGLELRRPAILVQDVDRGSR